MSGDAEAGISRFFISALNMQNEFFEGREIKPYGDFARPHELSVGHIYFEAGFLDEDMVVPELTPWVFIGKDLHPNLVGSYFQDAASYLSGQRHGAEDWAPTPEELGLPLPDGFTWGDEVVVRWERERDYTSVYEFEAALDVLLWCSLRRKRWDGNVRPCLDSSPDK